MPAYLRAYYRHVAADELAAAGPQRIAAVAGQHAELAARRPQGRAIVARPPGGEAALDPASDVIDIVTDDMPHLVDSITMELARHGLAARLVVHPQLRIRRDVSGAMREVSGPGQRRRADARRAGRVVDAHRGRQAGRRRGRGARR